MSIERGVEISKANQNQENVILKVVRGLTPYLEDAKMFELNCYPPRTVLTPIFIGERV